nr:heavy metal-associated domain-containing protein [Rhizobium laguerreae]
MGRIESSQDCISKIEKSTALPISDRVRNRASCVTRVERAIKTVPGVDTASVNLATERATVRFQETADSAAVLQAIECQATRMVARRAGSVTVASSASHLRATRAPISLQENSDCPSARRPRSR